MKLKSVAILGFKSFADKTVFDFGTGIVAIVGPNGCGKSNIVDAFRWVLGEQSAKSIRGDKMFDLIFSGTEKRKPLNFAEVTLTFSNEEKVLPIDYTEVAITRRIYRSGESEYLINKKPVRLRDIEALLFGTGVGRDAYSIFEQGKIDHVIHDTPEERRVIFEEAAGILRFKQRRRETLKKLELVMHNLERAQDIHQMVFEQTKVLESQAQTATYYKECKQKFEKIHRLLHIYKWQSCKKRESLHVTKREAVLAKIKEYGKALEDLEAKDFLSKEALKEKEEAFREGKEKKLQLISDLELKKSLLASEVKQKEELIDREARLIKDKELLHEKREESFKEYSINKEALLSKEGEFERSCKEFKAAEEKFRGLKSEESKLRIELKDLQQERLKLAQTDSRVRGELQEKRLRLETGQERASYLRFDEERIKKQLDDSLKEEMSKRDTFKELSKEIDQKKEALKIMEAEFLAFDKDIKLLQIEERELQRNFNEISAKKKALVALQLDFEGISNGSKRLLQASKQRTSPLFGLLKPLYETIHAEKGFEKALGPLLRTYSETLVVEREEDLKLVIEYAQKENIREFSLFCLQDCSLAKENGSLLAHLSKNECTHHFFENTELSRESVLFHRERGELSTKEGYYLDHKKVLFFPVLGEKNTFLREAKVRELENLLKTTQEALEAFIHTLVQKNSQREELLAKKSSLEKEYRQCEMRLVGANFELQRALKDKARIEADLQKNQEEQKKLKDTLDQVSEALLKWIEQEGESRRLFDDKSKQFQALEEALSLLQEEVEAHEKLLKEKEGLYRKSNEERSGILRSLEIFEATNKGHIEQERRIKEELDLLLERKERYKEAISQINLEASKAKGELHLQEERLKLLKGAVEEQNALCKEISLELKNEGGVLRKEEEEAHSIELLIAEEKASLHALEEQMTLLDEEKSASIDESAIKGFQQESKALQETLHTMQDVNLAAIEEYEKQREQEKFLSGQLADLVASKEELLKIIAKLDEESLKLFSDTFKLIKANFKKNYQILFEGGDADLHFTDEENLLESGIEITARPPGKERRALSLLSGGEKCLTALALLFALFEVKPSAFCILDEVDAPLDEMNIDRFTRMLKQFSEKTQFLVITHNKRTMSIADLLLGISMEEKGVSKLIALEFEREEAIV